MNLNFYQHSAKKIDQKPTTPILMIHGLFGDLSNLNSLGRGLNDYRKIIQVDVRNHGSSKHNDEMNYMVMAQDILETLDTNSIDRITVIGHSMGGKIAMTMTAIAPKRIEKIIVIDIAPVAYKIRESYANIFSALNAVNDANITSRQQAADLMRQYINEHNIINFLLKSFSYGKWRFNMPCIQKRYKEILDWQIVPSWQNPALFIRGEYSHYLNEVYYNSVLNQFPKSHIHIIAGSGHWVHFDKFYEVLSIIRQFIRT
ncbi:MAG: alpha/beta fold hydrolase [Candidatus Dasytiphilus stammeri]